MFGVRLLEYLRAQVTAAGQAGFLSACVQCLRALRMVDQIAKAKVRALTIITTSLYSDTTSDR